MASKPTVIEYDHLGQGWKWFIMEERVRGGVTLYSPYVYYHGADGIVDYYGPLFDTVEAAQNHKVAACQLARSMFSEGEEVRIDERVRVRE